MAELEGLISRIWVFVADRKRFCSYASGVTARLVHPCREAERARPEAVSAWLRTSSKTQFIGPC